MNVPVGWTKAQWERGGGSEFHREAIRLGMALAAIEEWPDEELPDPMPARTAKGERVWLHYQPLRWERHP